MIWNLDLQSDIPLYVQIRDQVVLSISKGELIPGDKLPTIRALSDESGINMMTISKGYQLLKSEGYVRTDRRSGTVVAPQPTAAAPAEHTRRQLGLILAELRVQGLQDSEILALCERIVKEEH